jgi:hypothetical protein
MGKGKERESFVRRGEVHRRFGDQKKRNVIIEETEEEATPVGCPQQLPSHRLRHCQRE